MPTIHPRPNRTVSRDSAGEGAGSVGIHPERAGGGQGYHDDRPDGRYPIPFKVRYRSGRACRTTMWGEAGTVQGPTEPHFPPAGTPAYRWRDDD
ncbi:hypothetical protein RMS29_007940 [Agrobacterium rosae]|uniref:Uncharacterized protein n=1 Tax=Agrobacterium rosae TaxID=1972867 RepID=A0ABU4W230_9HYPH|nr:hypothetical protein [Agrobacterium rosae]MCM2432316.1 hypothetical protein [Agrobacterium rosae]MDX8331319.1 hypothetical protein [Agrobacterium rosae]